MGRLTVDGVALDVTVLDTSSLSNPSTSVSHFPIGGGLPDVTRRNSTGLSGTLEFQCQDAATADAVYAAHLNGQVLHLDDWKRQNLLPDPHLRTVAFVPGNGAATVTYPTTLGPSSNGYMRVAWTTANTTSPQTIALVGSGLAQLIPATPGEVFRHSAFFRRSGWDAGETQVLSVNWHNSVGAFLSLSSGPGVAVGADWTRTDAQFTAPPGAAYVRPTLIMSGIYDAGDAADFGDVLFERTHKLRPFFSGLTPGTASLVNEWSGAANNSVSRQYLRPALKLTYVCVDGGPEIPHRRGNHWLVRVAGVQEVAA